MIFNKKALFILTTVLLSILQVPAAFAEGDVVCSGRITGTTKIYNLNSGVISFDAHSGPGAEDNIPVNLGVAAAGAVGLAPANRTDAACINKEAGTDVNTGKAYEYALKGWSWDTNGGFVSLNCKNKANNAGGADVACGDYNYGVYVSADKGGGNRDLSGYAWNPTFGWISMSGSGAGNAFTYGVKIDANGKSSGHAYTQAGIYIDFTGLNLHLPDKKIVVATESWCKNKPHLCVEITPNPASLPFDPTSLGLDAAAGVKIADGKDGYYLDIYFRDKDGVSIDPKTKIKNLGDIQFNWSDTVRLDQTVEVVAVDGEAVKNKPKTFGDFQPSSDGDVGHYISTNKIVSYAPTSESKLSITTSTKPAYLTNNETFLSKPDGLVPPKANDNKLILNSISYPNLVDTTDPTKVLIPATSSPIFPNGKVGLPFKFRPAIYVDTLYSGAKQDIISAYRSVPTVVKRGLKKIGSLPNGTDGNVEFNVAYSDAQTVLDPNCSGKSFNFAVKDGLGGSTKTPETPAAAVSISSAISSLLSGTFDLSITPEIPVAPDGTEADLSCKIASGATIYSKISYTVGDKNVSYYDNKLPRIGGGVIANPAVVVHGKILAQATANVQGGQPVLTSGSVNINLVRDAINENLQKNADQTSLNALSAGTCTFTGFDDQLYKDYVSPGCSAGRYRFDVGKEHVVYTKGSDITLDLGSGGNWDGKWVIISDGGNIFVDNNLLSDDPVNSKITLLAFRSAGAGKYYGTGNVYIKPTVKNIDATIVADGSIFSYDGIHANIYAATGEPKWDDYSAMISALKSQLLIRGAISSGNTIGGANLDQGLDPKKYLLGGGGRIIPLPASLADRMRAQYYDLNYLRMFKLDLKLSSEGLPWDQKCGKGWTPEDEVNLNFLLANPGKALSNEDTAICGEKQPCKQNGANTNQLYACNGIDPLLKYDEINSPNGDLIVPGDIVQAKGLDEANDFNPVYVYHVAPDKNSFVFSKKGAINISGK